MVNKQEIIAAVEECIKIAESAIPIYSKHIQHALFLSGLEKEQEQEGRIILETIMDEEKKHKTSLENLLTYVKGAKKDVF